MPRAVARAGNTAAMAAGMKEGKAVTDADQQKALQFFDKTHDNRILGEGDEADGGVCACAPFAGRKGRKHANFEIDLEKDQKFVAQAPGMAGQAHGSKSASPETVSAGSVEPLMLSDQRQARAVIGGAPAGHAQHAQQAMGGTRSRAGAAGDPVLQRSLSTNMALMKLNQALALTPEQAKGADYHRQLEYLERKAAGNLTPQGSLQLSKQLPVVMQPPPKPVPLTPEEEQKRLQEELMDEVREEIRQERQKERDRRQRELEAADSFLVSTYGAGKSTAISFTGDLHHVFDPSKAGEEPQEDDYEEWYEDELPEVHDADLDTLHRMWGMEEPPPLDGPLHAPHGGDSVAGSDAGESAAGRRRQPVERPDRPPAYVLARQQSLRDSGVTSKINPIAPPKRDRSKAENLYTPYVPQGRAGDSLVITHNNRPVSISFSGNGAASVSSPNGTLQAPMRIGSLSRQRSGGGATLQSPDAQSGPTPPRRQTSIRNDAPRALLIPGPSL